MSAAYMKIGGDLIKDALLTSVEVTQELNDHWWCTVVCRQTEDKRFATEQCLGQDIKILTYDQDGAENAVFDGFILDVELTYEVFGSYTAQLTAVTRSYKMDLTPRKAYYLEKTLQDVAKELAGHAGLQSSVNGPSRKALNYVQWGESDFDFLNRLVDDYGCWLRPSAKGIEIFNSFQKGVSLEWRDEQGLLRFKTKGTLGQPSFNGAHYDHHQMKSETYTKVSDEAQFYDSVGPLVDAVKNQSKKVMPPGYVANRARVMTLDDYQTVLKKESVRAIGGNITGHGESRNQQLLPGNTVQIDGTLDAHGTYGVTKVVHRWTPTGYVNEFWCTPWKNYTNPDPPEANTIQGLVPARVVDHNDPKKMGRIKVKYYWQEDSAAHWARMVSPHAGADRGFMFMPEKGDEVVVGFENGDPEKAVIFGCVWNGVAGAPRMGFYDKAGDVTSNADMNDNNVKRIVTKGGNRIQMVDKEGQQAMVLGTPHSIRIMMLEGCKETGGTMLCLDSSGDIFLNAAGRIHFKCAHFSREVGPPGPGGAGGGSGPSLPPLG
jgi:type VI secretion system secreted protein VgrG